MSLLTVDAPVITDAVRLTNAQGDGLAYPDSSMGFWPQRTNKWKNGGFETNTTGWETISGATLARITSDHKFGAACGQITSDGSGASKIRTDTSNAGAIVVVAGQPYTATAWLKATAGASVQVGITTGNNAATGLDSVATTVVATGNMQRVVITLPAAAAGAIRGSVFAGFAGAAPAAGSICLVDGVQLENALWATPYIETTNAAATRNGGSAYLASDLYSRLSIVQGWIAFRYRPELPTTVDNTVNMFGFGLNGDLSKMIELTWRSNANAAASFAVARRTTATGSGSASKTNVAWAPGTPLTIVMFWTATQVGVSVNGSAFVTSNIGVTNFAPNYFILGDSIRGPNDSPANGELLWCMIGNGTITQADSITLNNQGDADPGLGLLGATAQTVAVIPFTNNVVSSYVDAPVTNDIAGSSTFNGAGITYIIGQGTQDAVSSFTGSGVQTCAGGGAQAGTGSFTGSGTVYEGGGYPFFADSMLTGHGTLIITGDPCLNGTASFTGAGEILRSPPARSTGKIGKASTGDIDWVRSGH